MLRNLLITAGALAVLLVFMGSPIDCFGLRFGRADDTITVLEGEFGVVMTNLTHLYARETGQPILKKGAKVTRLVATDRSEVMIKEGAEVEYVETDDKAGITIFDGVIGYLIMDGSSEAHIKKMALAGGIYPIPGGVTYRGRDHFHRSGKYPHMGC